MPHNLPNIQNTYPYPTNNKAKARAKANYNLVLAMQLLGIAPHAYIQPHTPKPSRESSTPKPSRASIRKKPRTPPGAWQGKAASNGTKIDEHFSEGQLIKEKASKYGKRVQRMLRRKPATLPVTVGANVKVEQLKKAFERKKNQKPTVRGRVNSKRLSSNMLKLFQRTAPVPINTLIPSRKKTGVVYNTKCTKNRNESA